MSIGVCAAETQGNGVGVALDRADVALYEAKQAGRNRVAVAGDDRARVVA